MWHSKRAITTVMGASLLLSLAACGESISASISTDKGKVAAISVEPANPVIVANTTLQLGVVARYTREHAEVVPLADVAWQSDAPDFCTVSGRGTVNAVAKGRCVITASYSGSAATTAVTITAPFESLQVFARPVGPVGIPKQVQAIAIYADNSWIDVTKWTDESYRENRIQWMVDDIRVAGVSDGMITGKKEKSETRVTAVFRGAAATADFKVSDLTVKGIELTPASLDLVQGTTGVATLTALLSNDTAEDVTPFVSAASVGTKYEARKVDGDEIVKVSVAPEGAVIEGALPGAAEVSATFTPVEGGVQHSASMRVSVKKDVNVVGVELSHAKLTLIPGRSKSVKVTAVFDDGSRQEVTTLATWESKDRPTAMVVRPGQLLGMKAGNTEVIAVFTDAAGHDVTATLPVTVADAKVDSIVVSAAPGTTVNLTSKGTPPVLSGDTPTLKATGHYAGKLPDGSPFQSDETITSEVTWLSDTPEVASFGNGDFAGTMYAKAAGSVTAKAWLGDIVGQLALTVVVTVVTP